MRCICQFKIPNFTTSDPALSIPARPTQNMIRRLAITFQFFLLPRIQKFTKVYLRFYRSVLLSTINCYNLSCIRDEKMFYEFS